MGNLFVVDRMFFGRLRPEDIQYCHSRKLKTTGISFDCISDNIFQYHFPFCNVLRTLLAV